MESNSFIKKLYSEIPLLIQKDVISQSTANKIKAYYGSIGHTKKLNISTLVFGILGTLLVCSGIVLLIAHNWSVWSREVRTFISILPILASAASGFWVMLKKEHQLVWKETVSLMWFFSIGISIALISQTYHIPGHFEQFLFIWMLITLPLLYVFRAISTIVSYSIGCVLWVIYTKIQVPGGYVMAYLPLISCILPLTISIYLKDRFQSLRSYILAWTFVPLFFLGLLFVLDYPDNLFWIPMYGLIASLIYLLKQFLPQKEEMLKKPFNILGGIAIGLISLVLSYETVWRVTEHVDTRYMTYSLPPLTSQVLDWGLLGLLVFVTYWLLFQVWIRSNKQENIDTLFFGAFGLICTCVYALSYALSLSVVIPALIFNLFVFGTGIFRIVRGSINLDYVKLNTGLVMTSSIIVLRFFDSELSLSMRGIVLLFIGLGFWLANHKVSKRKLQLNV